MNMNDIFFVTLSPDINIEKPETLEKKNFRLLLCKLCIRTRRLVLNRFHDCGTVFTDDIEDASKWT